jgi:hypothetical protein
LQTHNRLANDDITTALVEHARSSIMYEKQLLRELEALRPDVNNAAKKVTPQSNGIPRPSVIPPLEDFTKPPGQRSASAFLSHSSISNHGVPSAGPTMSASQSYVKTQPHSASTTTSFARQDPVTSQTTIAPPSQSYTKQSPLPPQSPGAGPSKSPASSPADSATLPAVEGPPLGGKLVEGTRSMFIKRSLSSSPLGTSAIPQTYARVQSPLHSDPLSPLSSAQVPPQGLNGRTRQSDELDPLGQAKPNYMSQSVRVTPTRPRLDAREAASKLANMF